MGTRTSSNHAAGCHHYQVSDNYLEGKYMYNAHDYWEGRYLSGRDSGAGSYGDEAAIKIDIISHLLWETSARTCLDLGCGDGNILLELARLNPNVFFRGVDVSESIIEADRELAVVRKLNNIEFEIGDITNNNYYTGLRVDIAMCIDVLFHINTNDGFNMILTGIDAIYERAGIITNWNEEFARRGLDKALKECERYRLIALNSIPGSVVTEKLITNHTKSMYILTRPWKS